MERQKMSPSVSQSNLTAYAELFLSIAVSMTFLNAMTDLIEISSTFSDGPMRWIWAPMCD
jgi:hypothetical protein